MVADYNWPTNIYKIASPYLGLNHTIYDRPELKPKYH